MTNVNFQELASNGVKFGKDSRGFPIFVPRGQPLPSNSKVYNGPVRFPNRGGNPTVIPAGQLPPAGKSVI